MKSKALKWLNSQVNDGTTKAEIDIIEFLKRLVREHKVEEKNKENEEYIEELFAKFYAIYKRKGAKVQSAKTFRKKLIKLKTKEEILDKARKIAKLYSQQAQEWEQNQTELCYVPLCSSWLSKNIPD